MTTITDRVEALLRESYPKRWTAEEVAAAVGSTPGGIMVVAHQLRVEGVPIETVRCYQLPPYSP